MQNDNCLNENELISLLRGTDDSEANVEHIGKCAMCQERLDALAGGLVGVEAIGRSDASSPSGALIEAMDQLKSSSQSRELNSLSQWMKLIQKRPDLKARIGKYEIRGPIGEGGMGLVLKAFDPELQREVAIKLIHSQSISNEEKERFKREARAMAALKNEYIVGIYSIEKEDEFPFITMEFVDGESLHDRIDREGSLPIKDVVSVGVQICEALEAAHSIGLVHRDLKPANVLIESTTGKSKVTDFGLAKSTTDESLTTKEFVAGTPEFMSPEQVAGEDADARSDLFSLGTLLYAACTGSSPFRTSSTLKTLERIRSESVTPLAKCNSDVPQWLSELVASLMQQRPEHRIESATRVKESLLEQRTEQTIPPSNQPATVNRSRRSTIVLATLMICLGGGLIWRQIQNPGPKAFAIVGGKSFDDLSAAISGANDEATIEVSGDGPFKVRPQNIGAKRLTIRAADGSSPVFSSDGSSSSPFVFAQNDFRLVGIELHWKTVPDENRQRSTDKSERSAIVVEDGNLTLEDCRIVLNGASRVGCVHVSNGSIAARQTQMINQQGACFQWGTAAQHSLEIEQCVLEGQVGVHVDANPMDVEDGMPKISISRCSFLCRRAFQMIPPLTPQLVANIKAEATLFDCEELVVIVASVRNKRGGNLRLEKLNELATTLWAWSEANNIYRDEAVFLATVESNRPLDTSLTNIGSLSAWNQLWGEAESGSVQAKIEIRRSDVTANLPALLMSVDGGAQTLPEPCGADVLRGGAGVQPLGAQSQSMMEKFP